MSRSRQLALNMAANYLRFFVGIVVTFMLTPIIVNGLGKEDFGLWSLTWSTIGLLELIDLGLRTGVVKWVADARGRGDVGARNELVATHLVVFMALSAAAVVIVAAASAFYPQALDIPLGQQDVAVTLLWIVATHSVFLALPMGIFHGILFGEQRIGVINLVQMLVNMAYAVAVWLYLDSGGHIVGLAWLSLTSMILQSLILCGLAFGLVPGLRFPLRSVSVARLKQVFSFSSAMLVINVSNLILLRTDPLIVKLVLPLSAVAVYALALKIAVNFYFMIKQLVNVLAPFLAQLKGEGDDDLIRKTLLSGTRFALALSLVAALGAGALAEELIVLWVGPEYAEAGEILVVLLAATTAGVPPMMASVVLGMTGHHGLAARLALVSALVNVGTSLTLVGPLGLVGVALGTLITTLVIDNGLLVRRALRLHHVNVGRYLRESLAPLALPAAAQLVATLGLKAALPPERILDVLLLAAPGGLLFLALFAAVGTRAAERAVILSLVRRRLG